MSGRLVSAVLESALPSWLKPYAVAFASFAKDDGTRIYPSVATIGRMVGRSQRAARAATSELRRRRVLEVLEVSGPYRATRYRLNAAALPQAGDGAQLPIPLDKTRFQQVKPQKRTGKPRFPQVSTALTCSGLPPIPEAGFRRSVIDPSFSTRTRARAKTGTE